MAKSILCAIDFSESSRNALKWAADLSSLYHYHLTILYPYRLFQEKKEDVTLLKIRNEELASKKFDIVQQECLSGKNISFDFRAEVGFVADRIEDHLRRNSIVMLVISKNMNAYIQENLAEMIDQIEVPVLVLP
jgi:Universal stress protein family